MQEWHVQIERSGLTKALRSGNTSLPERNYQMQVYCRTALISTRLSANCFAISAVANAFFSSTSMRGLVPCLVSAYSIALCRTTHTPLPYGKDTRQHKFSLLPACIPVGNVKVCTQPCSSLAPRAADDSQALN